MRAAARAFIVASFLAAEQLALLTGYFLNDGATIVVLPVSGPLLLITPNGVRSVIGVVFYLSA